MKIAIIGAGNMGGAIARGLAQGTQVKASNICCSNPSRGKLDALVRENSSFRVTQNNTEAVQGADIVMLAVKPWLMEGVINEIKYRLDYEKQVIVSVAGGMPFEQLNRFLERDGIDETAIRPSVFRVIPNTAIAIRKSMTMVASCNASPEQEQQILSLFNDLGSAMLIDESRMTAGTALASCGTAFALRYIRAAMEGGVELGFYPDQAKEVIARTVEGAAALLLAHPESHPEAEIDKVTTPGGITIKGLNEMEACGFTTAVINGLKASK